MRLTVSPGAALSERHFACPPQLPFYKDFIAKTHGEIAVPPISPARSRQQRVNMCVCISIAADAVVVGILDPGRVKGAAASSCCCRVAEGSGLSIWRGLTQAGHG